MAKATTETCCLTLPLKIEKWQADKLEKKIGNSQTNLQHLASF